MKKVYEVICKAEVYIAKGLITVIAALIFVAAVARSLHYPIIWAVDAATFLFAWCVFLSGDAAMRNNRLVSIDIFTKRLPEKARNYVNIINYIIIMIFLIFLIGYGFWLSYTTRYRTFQGIPGFSYTWVTLSVPIGCILMLITAFLKIKEISKSGKSPV
jgi:TRAP-type C4-dicarboxylate transport system permease small subunit